MTSAHNDAGPVCHLDCCGGPVEGCRCWMCAPDHFPWSRYDSPEAAAADWGQWFTAEGEGAAPEPPEDAVGEQAKRNTAMASYHAAHRGSIPKAGR